MIIKLYKFNGEKIEVDKSANLILVKELNGTFRYESSLKNPVIDIDLESVINVVDSNNVKVITTSMGRLIILPEITNLLTANYVYIPDFNRYYYVVDPIVVNNQLIRLMLHVDVLYSYKDKILANTGFIERNEYEYNRMIVDDLQLFRYDKITSIQNITNITTVDKFGTHTPISTRRNILVSFLADTSTTGNVPSSLINSADEDSKLPFIVNRDDSAISMSTLYYAVSYADADSIAKVIYKSDTAKSYLKNMIVYPFEIPSTDYTEGMTDKFHFGEDKWITSIQPCKYPSNNYIKLKIADFNFTVPNSPEWYDFEPFTTYELYIPYLNYIELKLKDIINMHLQLLYFVNIETGDANVVLYNVSLDHIIYQSAVQLGINVGVSSTNMYENNIKKNNVMISSAVGLIGSMFSLGAGAVTGNPMMVGGGILGMTTSVASATTKMSEIIDRGNINISSGATGLTSTQYPYFRITRARLLNSYGTNDFNKLYGRKLHEDRELSNVHGFTKVGEIHLNGLDTATIDEIESIETLLKNGVLLP